MSNDLRVKREKEMNYIRSSVIRFATEMEKILREYDAIKESDDWQNESIEWLFERLVQGVFRLYGAIFLESQPTPTSIKEECCDVANFAMMIFDHFEGCLNKEETRDMVKSKGVKEVFCPKCCSRNIFKQWHLTCHPTVEGPYCQFADYGKIDKEHLHYYCRDCEFDWVVEIEQVEKKNDH